MRAVFDVCYQPGEIVAVGYTEDQESGRARLVTAAEPAGLRLTPDRAILHSSFGDLAYVTVEVVDQAGVVVRHAAHEVTLDIAGAVELIAVGTANPVSEELYVGNTRKAYEGRLAAVVRTNGEAGDVVLRAQAAGLATGR